MGKCGQEEVCDDARAVNQHELNDRYGGQTPVPRQDQPVHLVQHHKVNKVRAVADLAEVTCETICQNRRRIHSECPHQNYEHQPE